MDLVLDHRDKVQVIIKQVTNFFGFPVHIEIVFILYSVK